MSDSDESGVTYIDISSPFEELSDIGSPRADDHEHLELPEMLEDPYVEDQPYAEDASPNAQSPEGTYTDISSPFEELSEIGSLRANDHEHLELPEMLEDPYVEVALQAPPSPDYIPGPEEPEQAPPSPDYVPGPGHADDEIVVEDQRYVEDASPNAQSPEYVLESDFEVHPEDDDDEDPEEDLIDYLADEGDDDDDEEGSSEDDEDDDMDIEADEEEEEHPAPADSVVVASTAADQAPSVEETEPFETDESVATPPPHPAYRMTARISILALVPIPAWSDSEIVRLLAISSPPASPFSPWSLPPPQIPFSSLPPILSPPSPVLSPAPPPRPIRSLGYRAAMIRLRDEAASTSSPPVQLPSASRMEDRPEGAPVSIDMELGGYMREFETRVRQDTNEIYMRLDDEQTERQLLAEAMMSREAWVRSTDASDLIRDHRRSTEIIKLRTALQGQGLAGGPTQPELPEEVGSGS
nr:hypothetical protein [Tanacetum cinerariifolium]